MRGPNVESDYDPVKMALDAVQMILAGFQMILAGFVAVQMILAGFVNLFQGDTFSVHELFFRDKRENYCMERIHFVIFKSTISATRVKSHHSVLLMLICNLTAFLVLQVQKPRHGRFPCRSFLSC